MKTEFDGNQSLEFAPEQGGTLVCFGARCVRESVGDGGYDTGHNGETAETDLGILLLLVTLQYGIHGEVRGSGERTENNHREHEGEVLAMIDAFGGLVHPAIADGFIGPIGE